VRRLEELPSALEVANLERFDSLLNRLCVLRGIGTLRDCARRLRGEHRADEREHQHWMVRTMGMHWKLVRRRAALAHVPIKSTC
jgi:hypothetical protein